MVTLNPAILWATSKNIPPVIIQGVPTNKADIPFNNEIYDQEDFDELNVQKHQKQNKLNI